MPIAQGRLGKVTIGGTAYPVFDWAIDAPRNIVEGAPVGNTWATAKGEGLQTARFTARFMCRTKATEILASTFWGLWHTRTFGTGFDDTAALSIVAGNSLANYTLANAKAESYVLTIQKGQIVGFTGVFVAPALPTQSIPTAATSYLNTADTSGLLMFNAATIGGITGSCYGITVSYSNNHLPNGPLDGTRNLAAWEAGNMSAGASITVAEHDNASPAITDDDSISIALNGTRTITLTSVTPNNPLSVGTNPGQVYKPLQCVVQGDASTPPIVIS